MTHQLQKKKNYNDSLFYYFEEKNYIKLVKDD